MKGLAQPSESINTIEHLVEVRSKIGDGQQFMSIEANRRKELKMNGIDANLRRGSGIFGVPKGTVNSVLSSSKRCANCSPETADQRKKEKNYIMIKSSLFWSHLFPCSHHLVH